MFTWFNRLAVQTKLLLCFAIIVVVGITAIAWNLINVNQIDQDAQGITTANAMTRSLEDAQISFLFQELDAKDYLLNGDESYTEDAKGFSEDVDKYLAAAGETAFEGQAAAIDELKALQSSYLEAYNKMVDQVKNGTNEDAITTSIDVADQAGIKFDNRVDALVAENKDRVSTQLDDANAIASRAVWISTITMALFTALGAVIFLVARQLVEPIRAITTAVTQLEAGKFEPATLDKVARRGDQLGKLAELFQKMAREVASREAALKAQVEQLKIEIDVVKQSKQVSEITDSEFFQDLKTKSANLRDKKKGGTAPA